jgi:uncharacterized phage protein (TIGR01671 family)
MREIIFRGKRVDNGDWVEGLLWKKKYNDGNRIFISCFPDKDDNEEVYVVCPETVSQFTGLYDKNGKRIWENDIVCSSEYKGVYCVFYGKHNISCCGCCYHSHQSVGFYISDTEDALTSAEEDEWGKWEVIGNRFDNAELLTAERIGNNEN